jgi:DNA-directed RNA polymerase specialized sigma24 family protein
MTRRTRCRRRWCAWRGRVSFDGSTLVRAWLYRIATNVCIDTLRRSARRPTVVRSFAEVAWLQPYPGPPARPDRITRRRARRRGRGARDAMAGDTVTMAPHSQMMIHDAHGLAIGNAADVRSLADLLDRKSDNIASTVRDRLACCACRGAQIPLERVPVFGVMVASSSWRSSLPCRCRRPDGGPRSRPRRPRLVGRRDCDAARHERRRN